MNDERLMDEFLATCDLRTRAPDHLVERVHAAAATLLPVAPDRAEQQVWVVAPPRSRWAWLPRPVVAAAALGILAAGVAITLWLLRPHQPSVQPPIGTKPQVVQDHPEGASPDSTPSGPQKDSGEAPREPERGPGARPGAAVQPPGGGEGAEREAAPGRVRRDDGTPRSRRQRPRGDRWRPGRIAEETGRADTRGGQRERPADVGMPALYGRVASVSGQATVRRKGREGRRPALVGDDLHAGDVIKTDADSSLVAQFGDGSSLELAAETEVALGQPSGTARRPGKAELSRGDLVASIEPGGGDFQVETSLAVAAVRGTKFALQSTDRKAVLTVLEGEVAFWNDLGSVLAAAMERSVVVPGYAPTEPHRLAGCLPGGMFAEKWHLHYGEYLHVDTHSHTTPEAQAVLDKLRTSPETPELLSSALGPLWSMAGGIRLSVESAREVAGRAGRLTDLRRADLGTVHPLTVEDGTVGVPIFEVLAQSPAEVAGLQRGDAIVSIGGQRVATEMDLVRQLWRTDPETEVEIAFRRNGERRTALVATSSAPPGSQELALLAALRLLKGRPKDAAAQIVVANALACTGHTAEAEAAYKALRTHGVTGPVARNNLGVLAAIEGELGEALRGYGEAVELAPEFEGAWLNIATVYGRSGMGAMALALLERLVDEHPESEAASGALAWWFVMNSRGGVKLDRVQRLADAHPQSAELASHLARALLLAGKRERAVEVGQRVLAMGPSHRAADALATGLLGGTPDEEHRAYLLGRLAAYREPWVYCYGGSDTALAQGLELDPLNSTGATGHMWEFLGDRHTAAGRYPEAEECYLKAASLEPEWAMPWKGAGDAAEAAGHSDKAVAQYERAVEVGVGHGEAHQENLEVALRSAVSLATRAALAGDSERRERFIRLGEQAADKAEALANEAAPELYLVLINEYYAPSQKWEAAKRAFQRALAVNPRWAARAVRSTGARLSQQQHWIPSIELMAMILGEEPEVVGIDNVDYALASIERSVRLGDASDHAVQVLRPLVGLVQDSSYARGVLAVALSYSGHAEAALRVLDAGRERGRTEPWYSLYARARALQSGGSRAEALAAALKAVEAWPLDVRSIWLTNLLIELDPKAGAEAVQQRIAAEGRVTVGWLTDLAHLLRVAGDVEREEQVWLAAAAEHAGSGWAERGLAVFYTRQGRLQEAEAAHRRNLRVWPAGSEHHAVVQASLAEVLARQGRWPEAIDHACTSLSDLVGATYPDLALGSSLGALDAALQEDVTPQQAAQIQEALLRCTRAIDEGLVELPGATALEARLGRTTHRVAALAAGEELPQLALWTATKDHDRQAAAKAALAAASCAGPNADAETYTELAQFLAEAHPAAGLRAFGQRLEAAGGIAGPLGRGYVKLAAAAEDWERLSGAVDAILGTDDDRLAEQTAILLSDAGRHAEAMALMEHAVRIATGGKDGQRLWRAHAVYATAGQESRLIDLYEAVAHERPEDFAAAYHTAIACMAVGDRPRARGWLERAEALDEGNPDVTRWWAWWYEQNGLLDDARRAWREVAAAGVRGATEACERIDVLGEATAPVQTTIGVYVGYDMELGFGPCQAAGAAGVEAGKAGRPWMAVAAALRTLADRDPERMVRGARRAAEDYPDNLAAMVALAVTGTGIPTEGLEDPASAARAALTAADGTDPDLTPCVYTVCGEILLRERWREEAADAFRAAMEDPCMAPEWKARAEAGLQATYDSGGEARGQG